MMTPLRQVDNVTLQQKAVQLKYKVTLNMTLLMGQKNN